MTKNLSQRDARLITRLDKRDVQIGTILQRRAKVVSNMLWMRQGEGACWRTDAATRQLARAERRRARARFLWEQMVPQFTW